MECYTRDDKLDSISERGQRPISRQQTTCFAVDTRCACEYSVLMSRTIQLRKVPDAVHRTLKARAAAAGMSLSDYLLSEIRELAMHSTLNELQKRMERRLPVNLREPAAVTVRAGRDAFSR